MVAGRSGRQMDWFTFNDEEYTRLAMLLIGDLARMFGLGVRATRRRNDARAVDGADPKRSGDC